MSRLESLPPDLRAVLSLLLRQRKRPAEVAGMLTIEPRAVHARAHAALALLAPREARELTPAQRERLGEYLLGQQDPAAQQATRAELERSPAARAWALALARELEPLAAPRALPPIPTGAPAVPAAPAAPAASAGRPPSSRTGGAILLGAIAVTAVVAVVLIVSGGGGGSRAATNTGTAATGAGHGARPTTQTGTGSSTQTATGTTATGTAGAQPTHGKAITLTPPDPAASKALGVAYVLSEKKERAFYVFAKGLPALAAGSFYAVWLEGAAGAAAYPLGSLPAQSANGLIEGGGPLPTNAGSYKRILVTRETSRRPSRPGAEVLGGTFTLG